MISKMLYCVLLFCPSERVDSFYIHIYLTDHMSLESLLLFGIILSFILYI